MNILDRISESIVNMERDNISEIIKEALKDNSISVESIYKDGLNKGMVEALKKFEDKEYFLSEVIVCADTLNRGIDTLKEYGDIKKDSKGTILISVVEGDTHEIGKNIVKIMIESSGYNVIDLGVNQDSKTIIDEALKNEVDIIGLSSMMTTTMENMRDVIEELDSRNIEKRPKVIIGGGPVSNRFAERIGADGYSENAPNAVKLIQRLLKEEK